MLKAVSFSSLHSSSADRYDTRAFNQLAARFIVKAFSSKNRSVQRRTLVLPGLVLRLSLTDWRSRTEEVRSYYRRRFHQLNEIDIGIKPATDYYGEMNSSVASNTRIEPPPAVVVWHWPLFQSGWLGVGFMCVLLTLFLFIQLQIRQTAMGALAIAAVLAVTVWYWLPVRFTFRANGIERRVLGVKRRISLSKIEGYDFVDNGLRIFHTASGHSFPTKRTFISWNHHREEIEQMLAFYSQRRAAGRGSSITIH